LVVVSKLASVKSVRIAAGLAVVAALALSACTSRSGGSGSTGSTTAGGATGSSSSSAPSSTSAAPTKSTPPAAPTKPVHVTGFPDGDTVGVGMPIIADFNRKVTDGRGLAKGTTVTVNGKPVQGAWYFEDSDPASGHVMEAHYRLQHYWPAHADVKMTLNLKGVSAGKGLAFDGTLTSLEFHTGPANISVVNDQTKQIEVTSDGKNEGTYPVSLGAEKTPTKNGVKVIMEKRPSICMTDTAHSYYECGIKWDQRLTYSGEYLHSAPWNHSLGRADLSNGCTNLSPSVAQKLYNFFRVGDVVTYPNADGPKMGMGDGYGDWNVNWSEWQTGGAARTT
jgi:lipoprotein-anchoring transpeptidase ErfK/SrfK